MTTQRTIHDAVEFLPDNVARALIWQWEASQLEDKYNGDLNSYLDALLQHWNNLIVRMHFATAAMISIHALTIQPLSVPRVEAEPEVVTVARLAPRRVFYLPDAPH